MPDNDYIPNADAEAQAWANNFLTVANANLPAGGLVAGDTAPIAAAKSAFDAVLSDVAAKKSAYEAAIANKNIRRKSLDSLIA
ncbi:MAG: hypothetical protein H7Y38_14050 [Armatimonadetes bacterium]|nr:hypothetical protein [Armatimonadota bacterium]